MSKVLLITGATGKQGGAVVDALLSSPDAKDFTILAVTRNASSSGAQALANRSPNIKLVEGDLNDPEAIFKAAARVTSQSVWGVYSVQSSVGSGGADVVGEERQGKGLVDSSIAHNVHQFVYSSVDRGGDKSIENPTNIPHFITKHNIERHLLDKVKSSGTSMAYTILRPVCFMENYTPGFMGKTFATLWKVSVGDKKLQLISTADIGYFAAQAFIHPEQYHNKALSLAGDDLTFFEASEIFKSKTGAEMSTTFDIIASGITWASKEMGLMFKWFREEGYGANVAELKKIHPGLLGFGDWLKEKSAFETK
ncbi:NAD(P)-binding protein [Xylona heveae TC161]|uniref:NAD(P)-binding protein n=1 Tax=Xylona heveae (strain CBS 132557 / TC161) TaxID=1328760 RepID=A0A165IVB6_XYLHT|nr:NAD(P)-binding protein [Xylona heveae TC161]KZF25439.1 NAD(P)-binding protein [Xylona heveae TC161]